MALPPGPDVTLPDIEFFIDNAANEQDVHAGLRKVCKALLKPWQNIPDTELTISVVSGGISNALYKVSTSTSVKPTSSQPSSKAAEERENLNAVVVRVYGIGTEKFVDRERECKVMTLLNHHGFGAGLLGLFTNGRIESYLDLRPLNPEEMAAPLYATAIAATLARFHAVGVDAAPASPVTPFGRIREWLNVARGLDFSDDPQKAETFASFNFKDMSLEIDRVEKAALAANSPVVFGHNDLLSGNILVPIETSSLNNIPTTVADECDDQKLKNLTFIDFEYSDWTPRGFDWGNHFCEYAGFECDYGKYPDSEVSGNFVRAYLSASAALGVFNKEPSQEGISEESIVHGVAEANVYALASHMYWGTWAIMQAKWSVIDFDYMGYAHLRWNEYRKRSKEFLGQAERVFGSAAVMAAVVAK